MAITPIKVLEAPVGGTLGGADMWIGNTEKFGVTDGASERVLYSLRPSVEESAVSFWRFYSW